MLTDLITGDNIDRFTAVFNRIPQYKCYENKTTFGISKFYNGHEISVSGPKVGLHHSILGRQSAVNRGIVRIYRSKIKIDSSIVCITSDSSIVFLARSYPLSNSTSKEDHHWSSKLKFYELLRFKEVRPEGIMYLKLAMPEIFNLELRLA